MPRDRPTLCFSTPSADPSTKTIEAGIQETAGGSSRRGNGLRLPDRSNTAKGGNPRSVARTIRRPGKAVLLAAVGPVRRSRRNRRRMTPQAASAAQPVCPSDFPRPERGVGGRYKKRRSGKPQGWREHRSGIVRRVALPDSAARAADAEGDKTSGEAPVTACRRRGQDPRPAGDRSGRRQWIGRPMHRQDAYAGRSAEAHVDGGG